MCLPSVRSRPTVEYMSLVVRLRPVRPAADPFYQWDDGLTGSHGRLLRSRPFTAYRAGRIRLRARGWHLLYASRDLNDEPVAVSGLLLVPEKPWDGPGPRPVLGWAVGTQGLGDRAAPSYRYSVGAEYEGVTAVPDALARGWAVAMTDYLGSATPGGQHYLVGRSEGHAVLDVLRAAYRITEAGLDPAGPAGLIGYSQGGHAAAFAAEMHASYAPELNLAGIAAGGVPARLDYGMVIAEGRAIGSFLPLALIGFDNAYPELDLQASLTKRGRRVIEAARRHGMGAMALRFPYLLSSDLMGDPPVAERPDWHARFRENRPGQGVPSVPALVYGGRRDQVVPYAENVYLARMWTDQGAQVELRAVGKAEHLGGLLRGTPVALDWLAERFASDRDPVVS